MQTNTNKLAPNKVWHCLGARSMDGRMTVFGTWRSSTWSSNQVCTPTKIVTRKTKIEAWTRNLHFSSTSKIWSDHLQFRDTCKQIHLPTFCLPCAAEHCHLASSLRLGVMPFTVLSRLLHPVSVNVGEMVSEHMVRNSASVLKEVSWPINYILMHSPQSIAP